MIRFRSVLIVVFVLVSSVSSYYSSVYPRYSSWYMDNFRSGDGWRSDRTKERLEECGKYIERMTDVDTNPETKRKVTEMLHAARDYGDMRRARDLWNSMDNSDMREVFDRYLTGDCRFLRDAPFRGGVSNCNVMRQYDWDC